MEPQEVDRPWLESLTVPALKQMAVDMGLSIPSEIRKAELIDALLAAFNSTDEEDDAAQDEPDAPTQESGPDGAETPPAPPDAQEPTPTSPLAQEISDPAPPTEDEPIRLDVIDAVLLKYPLGRTEAAALLILVGELAMVGVGTERIAHLLDGELRRARR